MNYGWRFMTTYRTILKKKKCKKAKQLPEEALEISEKTGEVRPKENGKIYPFEYRVPKNSKER